MQFVNSPDGSGCSVNEVEITLLWRGCDSEDVVRRALASLLLQDPDHRLRVAHVESLLQLQLPAHTGYTSGLGLQTLLLKGDATASVFHVDFANTRVLDWRSRVVYLDVLQLSKEIAAARQRNQQQHLPGVTQPNANSITTCAANFDMHSPEDHHSGEQQCTTANITSGQQQQSALMSRSLGQHPPCTLEQIWGASPVFGACGGLSQGGLDEPPGSRTSATGALSSSIRAGTAAPAPTSAGTGEPRVSLFGGSFEVPHAIASCWAAASSCGSGGGSVGRRPSAAGDAGTTRGLGAMNPSTGPGGGVLDQLDHGCGGSSTASGSSSRSISAAARAAAAAASRLQKANNTAGFAVSTKAGPNEGASMADSASGMSGCLDVSTPKSYVVAGDASASASPVNSSSGEDDTEYNEAQLVFGSSGAPVSISAVAAAAADLGNNVASAGHVTGNLIGAGPVAAAPAGDSDKMPLECGVDWSQIAALQHVQPQQMAAAYHSHMHSHSVPGGQQPLLFGVGDMFDDAPPSHSVQEAARVVTSSHAMQHQQSAAPGVQMHTAGVVSTRTWLGDQAAGGLCAEPSTAAGGLFSSGVGNFVPASAPAGSAVHEMLLQPDTAAAAAGVSYFGAAATAAQLAESVLHDMDRGLRADSSNVGMQQMHPSDNNISSNGFSSTVHFNRSSNGRWATVVGAAAQASPGVQLRPHRQQSPLSDSAGDISFKSDQMKPGTAAALGSAGAATAGGGKEAGPSSTPAAAAAAPREKAAAGSATSCMSGAGPRLTGWASIAAKDPRVTTAAPTTSNASNARENGTMAGGPAAHVIRQQQVGGGGGGGVKGSGGPLSRLPVAVRSEVQTLVSQFAIVLKTDDFDEGVVHQLNAKRSEEEALAAVRHIAHYDLGNIQHMAAYLNHLVKHYNHTAAAAAAAADGNGPGATPGGSSSEVLRAPVSSAAGVTGSTQLLMSQSGSALGSTLGGPGNRSSSGGGAAGGAGAGSFGAYGGQIRLASVPVSTKAMLQKLPLKVFKQLEQLVAGCAYLEWRHFDAGVVKVLAQLSKLCESDVFEELDLLAATDLSNVEYMPAYLNKRLNNKLWSRRKADGHINNTSTG